MYQFTSEKINLLGRELLLSERTARDVNKLIAYSKANPDKNYSGMLIEAAVTIQDAMKPNYANLPFYCLKKYLLKRQLKSKNLLGKLTAGELFHYAGKVLELEGIKKKAE